jgi:carbon storage regulator CsrA
MLVVTCPEGESVIIELPTGERIEVVILAVRDNEVRLGTDAPEHMHVIRSESLEHLANQH